MNSRAVVFVDQRYINSPFMKNIGRQPVEIDNLAVPTHLVSSQRAQEHTAITQVVGRNPHMGLTTWQKIWYFLTRFCMVIMIYNWCYPPNIRCNQVWASRYITSQAATRKAAIVCCSFFVRSSVYLWPTWPWNLDLVRKVHAWSINTADQKTYLLGLLITCSYTTYHGLLRVGKWNAYVRWKNKIGTTAGSLM